MTRGEQKERKAEKKTGGRDTRRRVKRATFLDDPHSETVTTNGKSHQHRQSDCTSFECENRRIFLFQPLQRQKTGGATIRWPHIYHESDDGCSQQTGQERRHPTTPMWYPTLATTRGMDDVSRRQRENVGVTKGERKVDQLRARSGGSENDDVTEETGQTEEANDHRDAP